MSTLNNQALIVLGMHRSGTSAIMKLASLHGVKIGSNLMEPSEANKTGYWEHKEIVSCHDALLRDIGCSWLDEKLPPNWWLTPSLQAHRSTLREILLRDFSECPLWGLKDPRMCRLLPIWEPLWTELRCEPMFVLAVRHPLEVAKSLQKRNHFSTQKGERLWLSHVLASEHATRGMKRVIVFYDEVLSDWKSVMAKIKGIQDGEWLNTPADEEIESFLYPSMRHHNGPENTSEISTWSRDVYKILHSSDDAVLREKLDAVTAAFEISQCLYADHDPHKKIQPHYKNKFKRRIGRASEKLQRWAKK